MLLPAVQSSSVPPALFPLSVTLLDLQFVVGLGGLAKVGLFAVVVTARQAADCVNSSLDLDLLDSV